MSLFQEVIISYDIQKDKNRNKLYQKLLDLGLSPIQKSVFWGKLNFAERKLVLGLFQELLDPQTDKAFSLKVNLIEQIQENSFGYNQKNDFFEDKLYEVI